MSAYNIVPDDLLERLDQAKLAQLTAATNNGPRDDAKITAKIDEAEAEIHLAAGVYYAIPIAAVAGTSQLASDSLTKTIRSKVLDLAAYKLVQLKPEQLNNGDKVTYWSQLRKSIDTWLERLQSSDQAKRITLPGAQLLGEAVTASGDAWAESEENDCSFDKLAGWR